MWHCLVIYAKCLALMDGDEGEVVYLQEFAITRYSFVRLDVRRCGWIRLDFQSDG